MSEIGEKHVLRVVGQCYLPNVGYDTLWNGSLWKGPGIWMVLEMKNYFSDYEIVSELIPSNETYYSIQTVHDNRADMILSFFGMTHERHQFINFAYATEYATTFIISKASIGVSGEILEGVFDRHSYALSLVTLVVLTFIIIASNLLVQDPENSKSSGNYLNNICLRCIGHITAQGFPNSFRVPRYSGQLAWITLILFCLTFELMHSSIFISKLTATVNGKKIDNLHDLEKLPNMKILLREDSYIDNAMRQLENWHKFQSRIEYTGEYDVDYAELLTKIRNGTHVMIEDGYNFKEILIQTNLNESCQFHESEFQLSAERLFSLPSTFPIRKGFVHAEEINRRLMWIDAFGLAGQYDKNINLLSQGIFSPVKMDEDCKFDESMMRGPKGLCSGETKTNRVERLGWKHFRILFTYLAGGWALAGIVFLIELVKNPQKRQQSTQPRNSVP